MAWWMVILGFEFSILDFSGWNRGISPRSHWPVGLEMVRGGPWARISPPWGPAPGPMSMRWSAARMMS